MFQERC